MSDVLSECIMRLLARITSVGQTQCFNVYHPRDFNCSALFLVRLEHVYGFLAPTESLEHLIYEGNDPCKKCMLLSDSIVIVFMSVT